MGLFSYFSRPFRKKGTLLAFIFHELFRDRADLSSRACPPYQPMLAADLRAFIEFFLDKGFRFVSPDDLLAEEDEGGKKVLVTFDDGYFNNVNALPILKEFKVPATFFPTMGNVRSNRAFWWDIICRQRTRRAASQASISEEIRQMRKLTAPAIDEHIMANFGAGSFAPAGDGDRPFSTAEISALSSEELVRFGNHAMEHARLTNYDAAGIRAQISLPQKELLILTGRPPVIISYPHGAVSDGIIRISKECGLKLGVTTKKRKESTPLKSPLAIGRFSLKGGGDIREQCGEILRSASV